MAWTLEYAPTARKALRKLDGQVGDRILAKLESVAALDNPRERGKALTGRLAGLWRYRVGDWRVIAKVEEGRLVILVLDIGNRREIYRN